MKSTRAPKRPETPGLAAPTAAFFLPALEVELLLEEEVVPEAEFPAVVVELLPLTVKMFPPVEIGTLVDHVDE